MSKEVKIEDIISSDEFNNMTEREKEIWQSSFELNKHELQKLTNAVDKMEAFENYLRSIESELKKLIE